MSNFPYSCKGSVGTHKPSDSDRSTSVCKRCHKFIIRRIIRKGSIPADNVWGWAATILIKEWP